MRSLLDKLGGKREKIILAVMGVLIILTPISAYVVSLATNYRSQAASEGGTYYPVSSPREIPKDSPLSSLKKQLASPSPDSNIIDVTPTSTDSATLLLGKTLGFKVIIEGRPSSNQAAKVFLGLGDGQIVNNPKYLLSFLVNVNTSGVYSGLPLAGLDDGQTYTAYIKGPAQLATASAFTVRPTPIDLGVLSLITGDVNEDNVIDPLDYGIVRSSLGSTISSPTWNPNLDFNLDGVVNTLDLAIVSRNLGKIGLSGPWYSSLQQATKSASLAGTPKISPNNSTQSGGPIAPQPNSGKGYWMWMPTEF